jgi:hypothetical protein
VRVCNGEWALSEEDIQALARRAADDPEAADRLWAALGELDDDTE